MTVASQPAHEAHHVDGRSVLFETVPGGDPRVAGFEASHPAQRWCLGAKSSAGCGCLPPPTGPETSVAVLASVPNSELIAVARIARLPEASTAGHLTVCAGGEYASPHLLREILTAIVEAGRAEGFRTLHASVSPSPRDILEDCQRAGLELESALTVGGVSEVVFRLPR